MKITLKTLIYLLLFVGFSLGATAQTLPPDSIRIAVGLEAGVPTYVDNLYAFNIGVSLRADIPFSKRSYITGSIGYNNFFAATNAATAPQGILNVKSANLETIPLKIGYKYFFIGHVYVQGEVGETFVVNKSAVYATSNYAFTYSPNIGVVVPLKKHSYIDAGLRYEGVSSFYNDGAKYDFWAIHVAYAFNL